jgi:hypothetical protein
LFNQNYLDVLAQSLEQKPDRVFEACTLESSVAEHDCSIANPWISEINEFVILVHDGGMLADQALHIELGFEDLAVVSFSKPDRRIRSFHSS